MVTAVKEILGGGSTGKVTSISTSSSSSGTGQSSSSSSGTITGGGDAYGAETSPYDGYDYETYYDESTASPDGDTSRRVTITSSSSGGELDLGVAGKIDLEAGTGGRIIASGGGTSITITSNKTSVG